MKRKKMIIIIGIFMGALALRIYGITMHDLWFDELISNLYSYESIKVFSELSGRSLANYFVVRLAHDPSSVFYYFVVYIYSFLFGSGEMLRFLSVVFSMLVLGVFYKLSRLFFGRKVSISALLIMALSPMQIWYAQEARVYSMATFLVLLTVYSYVKALRTEKSFYLILFGLSFISACYASYFSVFLLLPMAVMFIWNRHGKNKIKWASITFLIFFSMTPLLFILGSHLSFIRSSFWLSVPSLRIVLNTCVVFVLGYSSAMWQIYTAPTIFVGLYIYGVYSCFRSNQKNAIILFLFSLPPIALTYLISRYVIPVYLDRQLFIYSPFYYLLIAKGVLSIKRKLFRIAAMSLVMAYIVFSLMNYYHGFMLPPPKNKKSFYIGMHAKKDYVDLMHSISTKLEDDDAILATDIQSYIIVASYFKKDIMRNKSVCMGYFFYPYAVEYCLGTRSMVKSLGINQLNLKTGQLYGWWLKNGKRQIGKMRLEEDKLKRVWLISSSWHLRSTLPRNSLDVRRYMSDHYKNILLMEKDGVYVDLFEIPYE